MTCIQTYNDVDAALLDIQRDSDLTKWMVRTLVTVHELPQPATTDEVHRAMSHTGTDIRKAFPVLFDRGLLIGEAIDGGRVRRGIRTQVSLTDKGRMVVWAFQEALEAVVYERTT